MSLSEIRNAYPRTYRLLCRMVELPGIHHRAVEGLTAAALQRIEVGDTPERDARVLLVTRSQRRS